MKTVLSVSCINFKFIFKCQCWYSYFNDYLSITINLPSHHIQTGSHTATNPQIFLQNKHRPVPVKASTTPGPATQLSHWTGNRNHWRPIWQPCFGPLQLEHLLFCLRVPDGGSIIQLRAYKCVVGSLSDSHYVTFGFDTSLLWIICGQCGSSMTGHGICQPPSTWHRKQPPGHDLMQQVLPWLRICCSQHLSQMEKSWS